MVVLETSTFHHEEIGGEKVEKTLACFFPITAVTHKTLRAEGIELAVWRTFLLRFL